MTIKIKSFYGKWIETTKDNARKFIKMLESSMVTSKHSKIECIETYHLKGISYNELFSEEKRGN